MVLELGQTGDDVLSLMSGLHDGSRRGLWKMAFALHLLGVRKGVHLFYRVMLITFEF